MPVEERSNRRSVTLLGAIVALLGLAVCGSAWNAISQWQFISTAYAAIGVIWLIAGIAMLAGGIWSAISAGKSRAPLWIAGAASALAGSLLVIGVVTYVVPCSGPG
jgi:hypothetical protein